MWKALSEARVEYSRALAQDLALVAGRQSNMV